MNPWVILTLWSFRKELKIVLFAFAILTAIPILTVILLTNTGFKIISDKLVSVNMESQGIQIKNPADGSVVKVIHPVVVWPVVGVVTLEFGASDLPYQPFHTGIDIANSQGKIGDLISPAMDGTVTYVGSLNWGYGNYVTIDHGNNITSLYGHMNSIFVKVGQKVHTGDAIGTEGMTGWATGPHVHFEIRAYGIPVNPRIFVN